MPAAPSHTAAGPVPALAFAVDGAAPVEHAAVPTLAFALRIEADRPVRSILLDTQVQIAVRRRPYGPADHDRLFDLFGAPGDWATTLRTLLWTRLTTVVPPFESATVAQLLVACTYDLEVAASRYFAALSEGEVPLELLFSGTVLYAEGDRLQAVRIPWEQEAEYRLPLSVWRETMDRHFPHSAWLRLGRESFDRLSAFRSRGVLGSWDAAVGALLDGREGDES